MHTEVCKKCKRKADFYIAPANDGKDEADAVPVCRDCLAQYFDENRNSWLESEDNFFKWVNVC